MIILPQLFPEISNVFSKMCHVFYLVHDWEISISTIAAFLACPNSTAIPHLSIFAIIAGNGIDIAGAGERKMSASRRMQFNSEEIQMLMRGLRLERERCVMRMGKCRDDKPGGIKDALRMYVRKMGELEERLEPNKYERNKYGDGQWWYANERSGRLHPVVKALDSLFGDKPTWSNY